MAEITVVLKWKRLRKWQDFLKLEGKDRGSDIFMATGYHPVFGSNSLLYIGHELDTLFNYPAHIGMRSGKLNDPPNDMNIYISHVVCIDDNPEYPKIKWKSIKESVVALLCFYHAPPYNRNWKVVYPDSGAFSDCLFELRIINIRDRGDLLPELSHYGQLMAFSGKPFLPVGSWYDSLKD